MNGFPKTTCLIAALACSPVLARPVSVVYRNALALPTTTSDQSAASFTITGLSGIAYQGGDAFVAVMDNSSKLVRLSVQLAGDGTAIQATVPGGLSLAESHDFEGIALAGPASDIAYLSEEDTPAVRMFSLSSGAALGTLATPPVFLHRRPNLGFESLCRSFDGATIWTANEAALTVDGPVATSAAGTTIRLLRYTRGGGSYQPAEQYAYNVDPLPGVAISGSVSGASDMVVLPDGQVLVMERSLALGASLFQTRIYAVGFAGATNVASMPALAGQSYTPVTKTLLYTGSHNNLEGLCLGPKLGAGRYAMLGIVDDGDPISTNMVIAFEISGVGDPACYANCDGSTSAPTLNVLDFACFLNTFAAGEWYANCDESSVAPALNVNDFSCFLNKFAAGCP